jgi:cytochrome bd-type quinol oxidase subunit 1
MEVLVLGIHYVYISIGIGTLILNAILVYFYIKSNKAIAYKHIPAQKRNPNLIKRRKLNFR